MYVLHIRIWLWYIPMNVNGYFIVLINTLETIVKGETFANCFLKGIPTRPEAFLETAGVSGQRSCALIHRKKVLESYSPV